VLRVKYLNAFLTLFVLALVGCAPAAMDKAPAGADMSGAKDLPPIKIGVIAPLVGDEAPYGADTTAAVKLAVEEINNAGGVNGRMLEAIYENGGCNGKDATTAATKLIDVDKVQVIVGGYCSGETLGAAPIAEAAMVALISPASSNPSITTAGDYVFRVTPSDAGQGTAVAAEAIKRGHHKMAVIVANTDYSLGLANAFKENFEKMGGVIQSWELYDKDSKDFRTQVVKTRTSRPDAVYIVGYPTDTALIIKQIRELKMTEPLYSGEIVGSKDVVEAAGSANIEGTVYATPKFEANRPKATDFITKAQQYRGAELTLPVFAANAYDAVHLIADAARANAGTELTGTLVKDFLYSVKEYDGAGGKLTIDENGDALKEFQVMYIHEGDFYPAP
jgi:branched-chain amino acid transport system substrate-binding protein